MWDSFQNLLPTAAGKYNFQGTLKAIQICQEYRSLSAKLLPKESLDNTYPKSYADQTLVIAALNSVWAGQIQMKKHLIQKALNEKFGPGTVTKLKIEFGEHLPGETLSQ